MFKRVKQRIARWQERSTATASSRPNEAGYNLLILMMLVLFSNLLLGVAMQKWSDRIQREKEEELIFRGLQYAEAIRIFQARFGRPPAKLEELIEMEPRSIRQLFPNPMNEDGSWGLLLQTQRQGGTAGQVPGQRAQGGNSREALVGPGGDPATSQAGRAPQQVGGGPGGRNGRAPTGPGTQNRGGQGPGAGGVVAVPPSDERDNFGRRRETKTTGPIVGVYAPVDEEGFHVFMNQTNISTWQFRVDLIPVPVIAGADSPSPRPNSGIFWRPFPPDLQPQMANAPGQQGRGQEVGGGGGLGANPGLTGDRNGGQGGQRSGFGSGRDSGSSFGDESSQQTPPPRPRRPRRP